MLTESAPSQFDIQWEHLDTSERLDYLRQYLHNPLTRSAVVDIEGLDQDENPLTVKLLATNDRMTDFLGYPDPIRQFTDILNFVYEDDRMSAEANITHSAVSKVPAHFAVRVKGIDERYRWVDCHLRVLPLGQKTVGLINMEDVTADTVITMLNLEQQKYMTNFPELLQRTLDIYNEMIGFDLGMVVLLEKDEETIAGRHAYYPHLARHFIPPPETAAKQFDRYSIFRLAAEHNETLIYPDTTYIVDNEWIRDPISDKNEYRSMVVNPLRSADGKLLGFLVLGHKDPNYYQDLDVRLIAETAPILAHGLWHAHNARISSEKVTIESQNARTDALTGLLNRRAWDEYAAKQLVNQRKIDEIRAVLLIDLDLFKWINDTYGHTAGDRILIAFSHFLREQFRDTDLLFRYGGEEIVAILRGDRLTHKTVPGIANRIRRSFTQYMKLHFPEITYPEKFKGERRHSVYPTLSIGVALPDEKTVNDANALLVQADIALYRAKNSGRNRKVIFRNKTTSQNT